MQHTATRRIEYAEAIPVTEDIIVVRTRRGGRDTYTAFDKRTGASASGRSTYGAALDALGYGRNGGGA